MNARWLALVFLSLTAFAGLWAYGPTEEPQDPPPLPADTLSSEIELLAARPFQLDNAYTHTWRSERPAVRFGQVLVLKVDPEIVAPRQTYEPVLYVGSQTAERLNTAQGSGHLVVLVPTAPGAELTSSPIFFGEPALPEQVDATIAQAELQRAIERGVTGPTVELLAERTATPVRFNNEEQLRQFATDLIEQWAPGERDLIEGLRAPRLSR